MGLPTATIIACPIPKEHAAEGKMINEAIEAALMECKLAFLTHFSMIYRMTELTNRESLINRTNCNMLNSGWFWML